MYVKSTTVEIKIEQRARICTSQRMENRKSYDSPAIPSIGILPITTLVSL
nr:MAG TPA: hypothetical protein [Bacteriophage sp.]